jgi:hypothetical protein
MLAFYGTIFLVSMRIGNSMRDPYTSKEGVEFLVLTTPISLHAQDFPIEGVFN